MSVSFFANCQFFILFQWLRDGPSNVPAKYIVGAIVDGQQGRMTKQQARANVARLFTLKDSWLLRPPRLQLNEGGQNNTGENSALAVAQKPRLRFRLPSDAGGSGDVTVQFPTSPDPPGVYNIREVDAMVTQNQPADPLTCMYIFKYCSFNSVCSI